MSSELPLQLSVIVPTYNRRDRLQRMLRALDEQVTSAPPFEVVVVVDGATDGTLEMLHSLDVHYSLRFFEQRNQGPAAARNRAMREAHGEILLFLDDDIIPAPGLLLEHLRGHRADPQAVVIGPMVPPADIPLAPWVTWEAERLEQQYSAMTNGEWQPTARQFYTGNASVRRANALAAGGFDEQFKRAEDVEFAYRLADRGAHFFYTPAASVDHDPGRPFASWLRVPYEYGRYDVLMAHKPERAWLLRVALHEWKGRHPLNRLLPYLCVGHQWRSMLVRGVLGALVQAPAPRALQPLQVLLCSPLFSIQYWQGIADAAGLGANPWRGLAAPPTPHTAPIDSRLSEVA